MNRKIFLAALLTTSMAALAQDNVPMVEAVSPTKQAELPLLNNPKLVIGETELTFTDNKSVTKFSTNERLVLRIKQEEDIETAIKPAATPVANTPEIIFSPNGVRLTTPQRGINIIRQSDGNVKKVVVK